MLPTSPLPNTRLTVEDFPQPVRSSTQVLDVLSEYVPGQKLIAEIRFQLANGAYRATVAQRDVTLALPFSARPGDSLELEVVETQGRIAFAVSRQPGDVENEGNQASTNTTLSRTGQLIGQLMQEDNRGKPRAVTLNKGTPLVSSPPTNGSALAPALQQALSDSGLFYESHLEAWANGTRLEGALRQEPQGQIPVTRLQNSSGNATFVGGLIQDEGDAGAPPPEQSHAPAFQALTYNNALKSYNVISYVPGSSAPKSDTPILLPIPQQAGQAPATPGEHDNASPPSISSTTDTQLVDTSRPPQSSARPGHSSESPAEETPSTIGSNHPASGIKGASPEGTQAAQRPTGSGIPPDLAPLVQQQLSSLANNIYPFHGIIWPGQRIDWEIIDENNSHEPSEQEERRQWKTRIKLLLPSLGGIDAMIELDNNDLVIRMKTSEDSQNRLVSGASLLGNRLELAGLHLAKLEVNRSEIDSGEQNAV